uniref:F-box domain-containing protein n=1 Tax=Timema genevievae TaxID=629358 RepID=A0A7R9JVP6_TIMGE|nr:unnamed protein product [Timema genevievae]
MIVYGRISTVFIDIEADQTDVDDESEDSGVNTYGPWSQLPDLVVEQVFSYLTIRQRYYASLVCRSWSAAFNLQHVWATFMFDDSTLTRRKFNYYYGWQHVLDHMRLQNCLSRIGRNIRCLVFAPLVNFFNLYEFMNMFSYFAEQPPPDNLGIGPNIRSLRFVFPCNMAVGDETEQAHIFGTGGKLLEALKRLMGNLPSLRHLELIDLMLDTREAQYLLDEVCSVCCTTLCTLAVVNTTKLNYQLLHVGVFLNLQVLVISPQNLGDDVVHLLANTTLRHLHLVQNSYTPEDLVFKPVSSQVWSLCRLTNPQLVVHLEVEGPRNRDPLWQSKAPVHSVLYHSPHARVVSESILTVVDLYRHDLRIYGHRGLPKFNMAKSFHDRIDSLLLLLCRQCPYLHTLVPQILCGIVRERISTSTVILLAYTAKNLLYFYVRRNAVILRCDWPENPEWTPEFYKWLRTSSRTYEATEREVSQMMSRRWTLLSDRQFLITHVNQHHSPY